MGFIGAKLVLSHEGRILVLLRDDVAHIPFPRHWDLPGGGAEPDESPVECALRELREEFGISFAQSRLRGRSFEVSQGCAAWMFAGTISETEISAVRFGFEGQGWRMMPVVEYLAHPHAVPHFAARIRVMQAEGLVPV